MKIFANKKIWKKIVIIFFVITLLSCASPKPVEASIGGALVSPICSLIVTVCDAIVNVVHRVLLHQDLTILRIDWSSNPWWTALKIAIAALLIAGAVCLVIHFGAVLGPVASKIGIVLGSSAAVGGIIAGVITTGLYGAGIVYKLEDFNDNKIDIPIYTISPEEIFRGEIPIFDVNFFEPSEEKINNSFLTEWQPPDDSKFEEEHVSGYCTSDTDKEKLNKEATEKFRNYI